SRSSASSLAGPLGTTSAGYLESVTSGRKTIRAPPAAAVSIASSSQLLSPNGAHACCTTPIRSGGRSDGLTRAGEGGGAGGPSITRILLTIKPRFARLIGKACAHGSLRKRRSRLHPGTARVTASEWRVADRSDTRTRRSLSASSALAA